MSKERISKDETKIPLDNKRYACLKSPQSTFSHTLDWQVEIYSGHHPASGGLTPLQVTTFKTKKEAMRFIASQKKKTKIPRRSK